MAISTAAALLGAAVIGGGTSIIAGNKSAGAVKDAAAKTDETNRYIYDTTRADYAPYREVGYSALGKLAQMYGVGGGGTASGGGQPYSYNPEAGSFNTGAASSQPYGGFQTSPGYQFRVDEAMKAIERSAAARGSFRSGATMDALQRRVQGVASNEYENYANRLAALAGVGQNATGSTAAAGANYAQQQGQTNMAAGNARSSSYLNTGDAINKGLQNVADYYMWNRNYGSAGPAGNGTNMTGPIWRGG